MSYASRRKERINKIISEVYKRIDSHINILNENPAPGIKIGVDDLMKTDANKLSQLATKANINVVDKIQEADTNQIIDVTKDMVIRNKQIFISAELEGVKPGDQVEFTSNKGNKYTAIVGDNLQEGDEYMLGNIKKVPNTAAEVPVEPTKEDKPIETQQEQAIYNLKNWAEQLQIQIGDGEAAPNNSIKFIYHNPQSQEPITILVLSNGLIKMSGHVIQDFEDLKGIIAWHKSNE